MDIKIAVGLLVKYVAPIVTKIIKSKISVLARNLYEKSYNRFVEATKSFEQALEKCFDTTDPKKLKKRILCCELGLKFFEKIHAVLDDLIPEYNAALLEAKEKYNRITGKEIGESENA